MVNITPEKVCERVDKLKKDYPIFWNAITNHRNTSGQEMVFDNRPEAIWVYKNVQGMHNIIIQKCSQVGASELLFNIMMHHLKVGRRVLFLVPNDTWRTTYVGDRINGLIKNCLEYSKNYSPDPKDPASMTMKTFYGTAVKFAGARNIVNLFSYPCKVIIVDEFDLCNQENLVFADDRTGWRTKANEEDSYTIKAGNPSIENWGINFSFKETNQYFWFAKCDCGHSQVMDWLTHFVEVDDSVKSGWKLRDPKGNPVCEKCHKPFERRGKGQYKKVADGKPKSLGVHMDKLRWDVSLNAIQLLFAKWEKAQTSITAMENFYNQNLGLPYEAGEHRITKTMLLKCAENGPLQFIDPEQLKADIYVGKDGKKHRAAAESLITTIAGVDQGQGKGNHMHISMVSDKGIRHKIYIGRVYSLEELEQKLDDYNVDTCVIDAQGGGIGYNDLRSLCERRAGQVYLCRYRPKDKPENLYTIDEDNHIIQANRTDSLDASFDAYKHQRVVVPQNISNIDDGEFIPQMIESVRTKIIDKNNVVVGIWKSTGADDHRHADNYELLAMHIAGFSDTDIYEEDLDPDVIDDDTNDSWDVFQ